MIFIYWTFVLNVHLYNNRDQIGNIKLDSLL